MTSSTRSICVTISWKDCPAEISELAGAMKELIKPWKAMTIPAVNEPCSTRYTPAPRTIMPVSDVTSDGIVVKKVLTLIYRYCCVLTLAWNPAQRPNTPFSAPLALMVSIMRMLDDVAEDNLALSRICTRVRLVRLGEMNSDIARLIPIAAIPIAVSGMLYNNMAIR